MRVGAGRFLAFWGRVAKKLRKSCENFYIISVLKLYHIFTICETGRFFHPCITAFRGSPPSGSTPLMASARLLLICRRCFQNGNSSALTGPERAQEHRSISAGSPHMNCHGSDEKGCDRGEGRPAPPLVQPLLRSEGAAWERSSRQPVRTAES